MLGGIAVASCSVFAAQLAPVLGMMRLPLEEVWITPARRNGERLVPYCKRGVRRCAVWAGLLHKPGWRRVHVQICVVLQVVLMLVRIAVLSCRVFAAQLAPVLGPLWPPLEEDWSTPMRRNGKRLGPYCKRGVRRCTVWASLLHEPGRRRESLWRSLRHHFLVLCFADAFIRLRILCRLPCCHAGWLLRSTQ